MSDSSIADWARPKSSVKHPLLGITILLVEDSRYCSETMRLLSIRSGARLRRADSLKAARRHLRIYRPDVAIIDLGLPDGSGVEIIREILQGDPPHPATIVTSGMLNTIERTKAMKAGASFFMEKPIMDLASFQQTVLAALPATLKPKSFVPRLAGTMIKPNLQALKDDIEHIDHIISEYMYTKENKTLSYIVQFLTSLAQDTKNSCILNASQNLEKLAQTGHASWDTVKNEMQAIRLTLSTHFKNIPQHDG